MAKIQLNGKKITIKTKSSIMDLLIKYNLNKKKVAVKSNYSIFDLLNKYNFANKKVAIEHNGKIVPKSSYKKKYLKNNDKLEIVHFIGGG